MNRFFSILFLASSFGFVACAGTDDIAPEARSVDSAELQRISVATPFVAASKTLATDGLEVRLAEGRAYQRGDDYAAVFPVAASGSGACEYQSVTYRESDGRASVSFELDGEQAGTSAAKPSEPSTRNASCDGFENWSSNGSSWCGSNFPGCLNEGFQGKWTREQRSRKCCDASANCWLEWEYRDTLTQCGC